MWERAKSVLNTAAVVALFVVGILGVIVIGVVAVGVKALIGAAIAWLVSIMLPWLVALSNVFQILTIFVLLPIALFRKTRGISGRGLLVSAGVNGLTLLIVSGTILFQNWGETALAAGLFLGIVGVVPLAVLSLLTEGNWTVLGKMSGLIAFVVIALVVGLKFIERASVPAENPTS